MPISSSARPPETAGLAVYTGAASFSQALALRGAKAEIGDLLLAALTKRTRQVLETERNEMGAVLARETREAQASLIDITNDLARQEVIWLPGNEDELIED